MPSELKLGFTGTRAGMTTEQKISFRKFARAHYGEFHNGLCTGADEDSLRIIDELDGYTIYLHPPKNPKYRSRYIPKNDYFEFPEDEYLNRDYRIVQKCQALAVCPKSFKEEMRGSGTWMTARLARAELRPIIIFWPDGTAKRERW